MMKLKLNLCLIVLILFLSINSIHAQKQDSAKRKEADTLKIKKPVKPEIIYETFDDAPIPPGGDKGYLHFLVQNIRYPQKAINANAQGTVNISIDVDPDGTL